MRRWLLILLVLVAWTVSTAWCRAQCGPGGCCPGGQGDLGGRDWSAGGGSLILSPPAKVERSAPNAPASSWRYEAPRDHYRSVVRVQTVDRNGSRSFGSGVAVRWGDRTVVLTAGHVVRDARQAWVGGPGNYQAAGVLATDAVWDVAVLSVALADDLEPVKIAYRATGHPEPGEQLESCGLGGDGRLAVNSGRFIGYRTSAVDRRTADWLVLSGHARGGDSGGPVFNGRHELVGGLWGTGGGEGVATQCGRLHAVLRETLGEPQAGGIRDWGLGIGGRGARVRHAAAGSGGRETEETAEARSSPLVANPAPDPQSPVSTSQSFVPRPAGFLDGQRDRGLVPICRPRRPAPEPAPQVSVQSDPEISRKLDVLIANTTPRPAAAEAERGTETNPAPPTHPIVMLLVVGGAVALGFVVYFGAA